MKLTLSLLLLLVIFNSGFFSTDEVQQQNPILVYFVSPYMADVTEITTDPSSVNVSVNSSVNFTCIGIGHFLIFKVNNTLASKPNITKRGFDQDPETSYTDDDNQTIVNRTLLAIAYEENNNSVITCVVTLESGGRNTSNAAVLMIQGILDSVGNLLATVLDGSNVSLTWTPPYSLDNVPITGYNIITSDGINITVNTPYHILTSSDPDPCNITTVSVEAINDVGTSQYNNVSFYYQTVPNENNIFGFAGLSQNALLIIIDISKLCVGERPNNITINVIYSNDIVYTTNISSIPMDRLMINHTVTLQNDWMEYFIVNVTLSNTAGEASYSFPLGHVGPVNNIRSSSTDCSIINVSWSRPSVHDRVNIHNYTLLVYRDAELIHTHTVNGNTTSYQFLDDELFNNEYTYVIYGSNELGEGDYSNRTFSYLKASEFVRNLQDVQYGLNEITVGPTSRNTTLNTSIKFTCQGIGDVIAFFVDGKLAASFNQGFQLLSESTDNGTVTRSLMATAYEENNNTNITCVILPSSPIITSPPAVLLIQGILDGVGDLMATVMDGSSVSLTWTPPYSLDNVPITGYNIITSDGINITVNTPYHILTSSDPDPCSTTVSVGAINDVGTSPYNNVSFYYQTIPTESDIFSAVGFIGLNQDILVVNIKLSSLCVGERPKFIRINVIYSNDIVNTTKISSVPMDQPTILQSVTLQNDWREYFIVNVTLSNTAGEVSYSFPLGHVGPVINIRSSSIDCSTINISWSRPLIHDRVNIHNYTLLIYRDTELIRTHTVNGNTTSYQFVDDELFNYEYTYVIYGSNELGEGDYSNGTFSYLKEFVRNYVSLTLYADDTLNFNIPIIFKCSNVLPVTINVSIHCDNTVVYNDGRVINAVNPTVALSDNITILPSQYESCQLFITLTSTNGISDSYNISIDIPQVIPTSTTSIALSSPTTTPTATSSPLPIWVIAVISAVSACIIITVLIIVTICTIILFCHYCRKSAGGISNDDVEEPPLVIGEPNTAQPMLINVINYGHQPEMEHASARSESKNAEVSQQLLIAPNDRSDIYDLDENPTLSLPSQTNNGKHSKPKKKNAKKRKRMPRNVKSGLKL